MKHSNWTRVKSHHGLYVLSLSLTIPLLLLLPQSHPPLLLPSCSLLFVYLHMQYTASSCRRLVHLSQSCLVIPCLALSLVYYCLVLPYPLSLISVCLIVLSMSCLTTSQPLSPYLSLSQSLSCRVCLGLFICLLLISWQERQRQKGKICLESNWI